MIELVMYAFWLVLGAVVLKYAGWAVVIWWKTRQLDRRPALPITAWMAYALALAPPEQDTVIRAIQNNAFSHPLRLAFIAWHQAQRRAAQRPLRGQPRQTVQLYAQPGVYVLTDGRYYKIGQSANVQARVQGLNTAHPIDLIVHCVFWTDQPVQLEQDLHTRFAARRLRREWFALKPADLAALARLHMQASAGDSVK